MKIFGTFGPSAHTKEVIYSLFEKGMTGMRLNLSHTNLVDCRNWVDAFWQAAKEYGIEPDLLIDMKGPELRIGSLEQPIELVQDYVYDLDEFDVPYIVYDYVKKGSILLLDDGKIRMEYINNQYAKVLRPGILSSKKSVAIEGIEVDTPTLTEEDIENLKHAKEFGVTGLMQPFVRNAKDLQIVQQTLKDLDLDLKIYAKIENQSGVNQVESLLDYCDEIIIARGDLGNAVGLAKLPSVQKKIEKICQKHHKPYMVVTEMLASMIHSPVCTRAEVSDIYHAVYLGASSIMLTGEIAAGKYPVEAMDMFVQVAKSALEDR
ncbi:MAG: pyruvate kinase [Bacillota bacterium]|nr:pyruvate kinase [Bacillota bacterium]